MAATSESQPDLPTEYEQLCLSYRAIDDFRAKLLGFLPFVTGGGIVLLTGRSDEVREDFFLPVGLLGIAVTTGLTAYEVYGIGKCAALINAGKTMERGLRPPDGQFTRRPDVVFRIVDEPFAAAVIYPAVLAAWTYVTLYFVDRAVGAVLSIGVFAIGAVLFVLYDRALRRGRLLLPSQDERRQRPARSGT